MKLFLSVLACVLSMTCLAQHHFPGMRKYDFSKVDPSTVDKDELKKKLETARVASGYDSLQALTAYVYTTDDNQFATLAIGYQHAFASLSNLKRELAPYGFNNISENMSNILLSLDLYKNRFMTSFILTPGFRNKTSNEDLELRTKRRTIEVGVGYDLVKNRHIDLFPQIAIGFQDFLLDVKQNSINVNTIPDLLEPMVNTSMRKRDFIFTYGGEFDYKIYTESRARIILGVRYAQVVEAGAGHYRVNGESSDFRLNDEIAKSTLSLVVKMVPGAHGH
ncbi:hypothetical protein WBG78_08205 [Chryseolinea sp. T2]|uniref:hypothetical protein n=1 Tax=Chryseolinea sp. T2 TaxID=3129255 RepID=UPI003077EE81